MLGAAEILLLAFVVDVLALVTLADLAKHARPAWQAAGRNRDRWALGLGVSLLFPPAALVVALAYWFSARPDIVGRHSAA